jgi:transcriptional regulator with PAS, ATPase and Fis domain
VLLFGETGTGKELLAHAIHGGSARANQPLVTVNVAAIPDTLLEVEFFGAAPGAYTGVDRKGRVGKFELSNGGTLFLDEIGDMPLPLQGKLLRVLQDKEFEPLGSNRIVRADVRIIAATSADLPALASAGRFRADLFYRLNVLTIHAPPLRERSSDIEALAYAILEDLSTQARAGSHFELQDDALRLLCSYAWPGNVRELRNTLERAVMLSDSERIDARTLAPFIGSAQPGGRRLQATEVAAPTQPPSQAPGAIDGMPGPASWSDAMAAYEKRFLSDALRANGGRVIDTASQIGMGRATLYKKIAAYGIEV